MTLYTARIKVLAYSQQMLNAAHQERWDELAQLEREFSPMIESFFAQADLLDAERETLSAQLLEQNAEIQALIKQEQKRILAEQSAEGRNARAMHSYLDVLE